MKRLLDKEHGMVNELFPVELLILDFFNLCEKAYKFAKHDLALDESKYAP